MFSIFEVAGGSPSRRGRTGMESETREGLPSWVWLLGKRIPALEGLPLVASTGVAAYGLEEVETYAPTESAENQLYEPIPRSTILSSLRNIPLGRRPSGGPHVGPMKLM